MFRRTAPIWLLLCFTLAASSQQLDKVSTKQIVNASAEKGTVILNYWATWCIPCVEEIPVFTKLQMKFANAKVIGISMDEPDREELVQKFMKDHSMNYRVALWTGNDFEEMVNSMDKNWSGAIPATFVFRDGKRIYQKVGQITEAELTGVLQ